MTIDFRGIIRNFGLQNRSVVLFLVASFLVQSTMGALNVILNLYILELGYTEDFAGMILSIKLFTTGIVCIPIGIFCARWGIRRALLLASSALGIGVLLLSIGGNPIFLMMGAVLIGSAQATKAVSMPPFLVENSDPRFRQNLFSLNFSLMMFANMAGNFMSGYLPMMWLDTLTGFTGTLRIYGVIAILSLIPLFAISSNGKLSSDGLLLQLRRGLSMISKEQGLRRLLLCHAMIGFGAGLIVPLFNIFLSNRVGASSGQIGIIMSLAQTGTAIGGLLVPLIVMRLKSRIAAITILRLTSIPFLILIATLTNIYGVAIVFFMRSTLMNMTHPVEQNFSMEMTGQERRAVWSSMLKTMDTLTRAISVLIGGWMMATWNYSVPYYFTCALYFFTCVVYWRWFRPMEKPVQQVELAG